MKLVDVLRVLREKYPEFLQYEWDNSGINIGDFDGEIKKILTTLEITEATVDEAIENDVDLIVSHHPFLFSRINSINTRDKKGKLIYKLIKNNISVYCMHTNYDVAVDGLNDMFLDKVGIKNIGILDVIGSKEEYRNGESYGLGRIGLLDEPMNAEEFVTGLKSKLKLYDARLIGNRDKLINKVAVVTGSGAEYFNDIANSDIDILITGDMKYHQAVDASELDVTVVDLGHFGTEYIFSEYIRNFLVENLKNVEVQISDKQIDPFFAL